jgi:hypothetical protein
MGMSRLLDVTEDIAEASQGTSSRRVTGDTWKPEGQCECHVVTKGKKVSQRSFLLFTVHSFASQS